MEMMGLTISYLYGHVLLYARHGARVKTIVVHIPYKNAAAILECELQKPNPTCLNIRKRRGSAQIQKLIRIYD